MKSPVHETLRRGALVSAIALPCWSSLAAQQSGAVVTNVSVGAVATVEPRYPGSDEHRFIALPRLELTVAGRGAYVGRGVAAGGRAIGIHAVRTPRFGIAAEAVLLDNRPADRADALAGMDDRNWAPSLGATMSYRVGPLEAGLGVVQGFSDGAGVLGRARLSVTRPFGRLIAVAGVGATVADDKQMRREFGVTGTEAARRAALIAGGDPRLEPDESGPYRPDGGLGLLWRL